MLSPPALLARPSEPWHLYDTARRMPWKDIPGVDWRSETVQWSTIEAPVGGLVSPGGRRTWLYSGGCYFGFYASGGPEGVGRATGRAIRASIISLTASNAGRIRPNVAIWATRSESSMTTAAITYPLSEAAAAASKKALERHRLKGSDPFRLGRVRTWIALAFALPWVFLMWTFSRGKNLGYGGPEPRDRSTVALDLGRMNRILEIDYANRCVVAQSGVTNLAISHAVATEGFYYAPDPSSQIACTIGGRRGSRCWSAETALHARIRHNEPGACSEPACHA